MDKEALKSISVIFIEDEPEIIEALVGYFERKVKVLYTAANGKAGMEMIVAHKPDVIVTDLEMPGMNGLQMIDALHTINGGYRPIIVATGYDDAEHKSDFVDAYIFKPLNLKKLAELIYEMAKQYNKI